MLNLRSILSTILVSSVIITCAACSRNESAQSVDSKVIASINKYDLTVADFMSEAQGLPEGLPDADYEKSKEVLLEGIITKKILIQEAQEQNFDKDKAFIKEIERYWEQTLLKSLYNKKSQEILSKIEFDESLSPLGLNKKAREEKARVELSAWIDRLKERADIKKYAENLKEIKQK